MDAVTSTASTKPSSILSSTDSRHSSSQTQFKARDRSSLPNSGVYAELIGNSNFDEFLQKHLGNRESMTAAQNGSKQRTQYYEDQLQYKENAHGSTRERVQRDSPVVAELRTNVIIKDEFTLVTDLSCHLAARYSRPDSAVMVKVDHSACLAYGGTFDPCYILSITAVPSQMGPTMNKRNAALIQAFLADILSVPPERGVVKFQPVPDENFATNGMTIFGEIERQEKQHIAENGGSGMRRAMNNASRRSVPNFRKSSERPAAAPGTDNVVVESSPTATRNDSAAQTRVSNEKGDISGQLSATITNPEAVFELPTTEMERKQPSTSHNQEQSLGSNGLAMNGISSSAAGSKTSKKERPRTISGHSAYTQNQIKSMANATSPPSSRVSSGTSAKQARPPSFLKVDPTQAPAKATSGSRSSRQSAVGPSERPRPRNTYLDGVMGNAKQSSDDHQTAGDKSGRVGGKHEVTTIPSKKDNKKDKKAEKDEKDDKKDTEANTAKRRSTITATPKMPEAPPIPADKTDAKSAKSLKVGKRKSFLSAFKRSTPRSTS